MTKSLFPAVVLASMLLLVAVAQAQAPAHEIEAVFDPAARRLAVTARLALPAQAQGEVLVTLSPRASIERAEAGGASARYVRAGDGLRVRLPSGATSVALRYTLPLDPPPRELPATMDNPGAVASDAVCGSDWAMLAPGSLWHPEVAGGPNAYRLRLDAPEGILAVTQGALVGRESQGPRTVTIWDIPRPVGRLGLSLAAYRLEQGGDAPVTVQTFLLQDTNRLAPVYLQAAAKHLAFYANLHGPYAFGKFAVVENPLPTGYGFPSYTLLGSQVLPLPFIPETALRHEIAHSWWGNGVLLDPSQGNWCEGLTTYVADYLVQEERSPGEARDYRLRALRNFATLAGRGRDMPLARFGERFSPASQAVGYGKAMFVFHMLRGFVGDQAFWDGLRRLYRERLLKPTGWEDIRRVFAGAPGLDEARSRAFFRQWLRRTGGPKLRLDAVHAEPGGEGGRRVVASVSQAGRPYLLKLRLEVETDAGKVSTDFVMDGPMAEVAFDVPGRPLRAALDPGADCFRLLAVSEVPPSVNSLKAGPGLAVIVARDAPQALRAALPRLMAGLGRPGARLVSEESLSAGRLASLSRSSLLVVGRPRVAIPGLPDLPAVPGLSTSLGGQEVDTSLQVLPRPGGITALLQCRPDAPAEAVATAASKITHYGGYGLLGFKDGRNVLKRTGEPQGSPLVKEF